MERDRFYVDSDTCTGDHSCIRMSGCPSLTLKENPDPLKSDPVAYVDNSLCWMRSLRRGRPCVGIVSIIFESDADL